MKKALFPLLLLALLSSTGCVKEVLLSSRLNGDWRIERSYTSFIAIKDFSFANLYSSQWSGTVLINGVTVENPYLRFSYNNRSFFEISRDISILIPQNTIFYRKNIYAIPLNQQDFYSGSIKTECSFVYDNQPVTIKIDVKSPVVEMKRDCRYEFNLGEDPAGVPIREISFNHFHKTKGTVRYDDIIDNFSGSWDLSIGQLFLAFKSDIFNAKHLQKYRYSFGNDRMYLTNPVKYSKYAFYGTIPEENIKDITYTNVFKRK